MKRKFWPGADQPPSKQCGPRRGKFIRASAAPRSSKAAICAAFREAVDIFFDGKTELLLTAPFVKGVRTHGTGCTYSAAICAALALGHDLPQAVESGKEFITSAIANSHRIGNHFAFGNLWWVQLHPIKFRASRRVDGPLDDGIGRGDRRHRLESGGQIRGGLKFHIGDREWPAKPTSAACRST